jgi:hypothetical protein
VLLLNNPGTGKSVFQFYLLARYLNPSQFEVAPPRPQKGQGTEATAEAVEAVPKVVIRHTHLKGMQVWFLEQQSVHFIEHANVSERVFDCFDPTTTQYFFEPGSRKGLERDWDFYDPKIPETTLLVEPFVTRKGLPRFSLTTVSTDRVRRTRFPQKRSPAFVDVARRVYFPYFEEDELVAIERDMKTRPDFNSHLESLYSDDAIRGRFATFDGIIGFVLPQSKKELQLICQERAEVWGNIDKSKFHEALERVNREEARYAAELLDQDDY